MLAKRCALCGALLWCLLLSGQTAASPPQENASQGVRIRPLFEYARIAAGGQARRMPYLRADRAKRKDVIGKRTPSTICPASSHLNSHTLLQLGKLRLGQNGTGESATFGKPTRRRVQKDRSQYSELAQFDASDLAQLALPLQSELYLTGFRLGYSRAH
jgi:hypothetical protein